MEVLRLNTDFLRCQSRLLWLLRRGLLLDAERLKIQEQVASMNLLLGMHFLLHLLAAMRQNLQHAKLWELVK